MNTRSDAIRWLTAQGADAFARDWSLGESIGVGRDPDTSDGVTTYRRLIWIYPDSGTWIVTESADMRRERDATHETLDAAARDALERLTAP